MNKTLSLIEEENEDDIYTNEDGRSTNTLRDNQQLIVSPSTTTVK